MKKIISVIMAAVLMLSGSITVFAQESAEPVAASVQFTDVPQDAYYYEAVQWAIEKGITTGTSETTFSPDDTCNLAQIITFLWRAKGSPTVKTSPKIADVYPQDYYYMAAYWAQSIGIFDRALYPNFSASRVASVYFIWCAAGRPECKVRLRLDDANKINDMYYEAVAWALDNGVTTGTSETTFSPSKTCTRAQIITFLYRAALYGFI